MAEYNPSKIIKDGNTYNFRDTTKIPLAGSNAISGSLIPATDNSIDIGSSASNIKMLYTKGVTINAKTIDTDANGNMTYDGHIVDTIEEQGNGYIRYSNGLQICWGTITWKSACSQPWASLYQTSSINGSYAKSFAASPSVSTASLGLSGGLFGIIVSNSPGSTTSTPYFFLVRPTSVNDVKDCAVGYIAIGRWQ